MLRPILFLLALFSAASVAAPPQIIEIKLNSYSIQPATIHVPLGQPVTLRIKNEAPFISHDLAIKAPQAGIEVMVEVSAGKMREVSFTPIRVGEYEMFCDKHPPIGKSHKEKGMHAMLRVE